MGVAERKERERENKRELIIQAAEDIMLSEGIQAISIRKIASKLEYSPALVYHYFQDKEDIINHVVRQSYKRILESLHSSFHDHAAPEQNLVQGLKAYIHTTLSYPEAYQYIMLSESPEVLEHTSVLEEGVSHKKEAFGLLCEKLKLLGDNKSIDEQILELKAQAVWTAVFGLILRLKVEAKRISKEQKNKLIDQQIELLVAGIVHTK